MALTTGDKTYRTITEWVDYYRDHKNMELNENTVRKRRAMGGIGTLVPPRVYLLTEEEFERVLATPLPGCARTITADAALPKVANRGRKAAGE